MTLETLLQPPTPAPELLQAAFERGWSEELVHRAVVVRMPMPTIQRFLAGAREEQFRRAVEQREQLKMGPLRLREATQDDAESLVDLFNSSPEEIGDWEVTVERGPYPFAQFRLQENVQI